MVNNANLKTLEEMLLVTKAANDKLSKCKSYKVIKPLVKYFDGKVFEFVGGNEGWDRYKIDVPTSKFRLALHTELSPKSVKEGQQVTVGDQDYVISFGKENDYLLVKVKRITP